MCPDEQCHLSLAIRPLQNVPPSSAYPPGFEDLNQLTYFLRWKKRTCILELVSADKHDRILPWEVFDTFDEGLFEGVAPYVVDDEVGGGVDDKEEVVHAGQAELPSCWPEALLLLALTKKKQEYL